MKVVFNSSPLIFLRRLSFLDLFLDSLDEFYLPIFVVEEIGAKSDKACQKLKVLIKLGKIAAMEIKLI
ncbi:MAG: DUF3368 domain-containing protein, partial [Nostoc sp.]